MTSVLPGFFQSVYSVYELPSMREEAPSQAVRLPAPGEADREELVLKKLGPRGWGRLYHFRNFYGQGWGEGAGNTLSPRALEGFYRFLEKAEMPQGGKPSLFLTDDGNLELCWEDSHGKSIEIEFTPSGAEFYLEAEDREGSASFEELPALLQSPSSR